MRKWVSQPHILTWFWDKGEWDRMLARSLDHDEELVNWCMANDCGITRDWVQCPDEETYLMFYLRWVNVSS